MCLFLGQLLEFGLYISLKFNLISRTVRMEIDKAQFLFSREMIYSYHVVEKINV